jgi:hypothetical protein
MVKHHLIFDYIQLLLYFLDLLLDYGKNQLVIELGQSTRDPKPSGEFSIV